jgi:uncharacterized protein YciI
MSIENFIDNVMDKDYTTAQVTFADLMQARMQDALDQQKIVVAGQMFGEEDDPEDIDDEDLEDAFEDEDLDEEDFEDDDLDDEIEEDDEDDQ